MAPKIEGISKTLNWSDFQKVVQVRKPAPDELVALAGVETAPDLKTLSYKLKSISKLGLEFEVVFDDFTANVYPTQESWKSNLIPTFPQLVQNDLLHHEQGHYNIEALIWQEAFNKIMNIKKVSSQNEFDLRMGQFLNDAKSKIKEVQLRYDIQTKHGLNKAMQTLWDGKISAAKKDEICNPSKYFGDERSSIGFKQIDPTNYRDDSLK